MKKSFNCDSSLQNGRWNMYSYAITEVNRTGFKILRKCCLSRSGQYGYATWIKWEVIIFGQNMFPVCVPITQRTFLGTWQGSSFFFLLNITVFKVCINPLNSVLCVSSEVRLLPLSALLSILSHCVRQHVSTRFVY